MAQKRPAENVIDRNNGAAALTGAAADGIIIRGIGGIYTVACGDALYDCKARGIFRLESIKPMVGDLVKISPDREDGSGFVITEIKPRKNSLVRPAVANVDCVLFIIAAANPKPDLTLLDKLLLSVRQKGAGVILVINKSDIDRKEAKSLKDEYESAVDGGVFIASLEGKDAEKDAEKIKSAIPRGVTVLCGQSGVGKSTLTNKLLLRKAMATGGLSAKTERGRHTTRHSELFDAGDGKYVIDSPGFSFFDAFNVAPKELADLYKEFDNRGLCRFQDCSHTGEPDCCVGELLEKGILSPGRYGRYKEIYKELLAKEKNKYR